MSEFLAALSVLFLLLAGAFGFFALERWQDSYKLENGVPHCIVFDYKCSLGKEVGKDD